MKTLLGLCATVLSICVLLVGCDKKEQTGPARSADSTSSSAGTGASSATASNYNFFYNSWINYNVGSNSVLIGDAARGPFVEHFEVKYISKGLTRSNLIVNRVCTGVMDGKTLHTDDRDLRPMDWGPSTNEVQLLREEKVQAIGKEFNCKVYKLTGTIAQMTVPFIGGSNDDPDVTVYLCPDVPGSIVKIETVCKNPPQTIPHTLTLSAMESK